MARRSQRAAKGPISKDGVEDVGLIRGFRIWFCNKFPCCRDDTVFAVSEIFCMVTALKFQVLNNKRNLDSTRKPSTARSEETPYCSPRAL